MAPSITNFSPDQGKSRFSQKGESLELSNLGVTSESQERTNFKESIKIMTEVFLEVSSQLEKSC